MKQPRIKILIATHKPGIVHQDEIYTPIQVGKTISNYDLKILSDDTGDNISDKNSMYCELTALYWAWKNLKNIDYIGLCHYRRFFDFHKQVYQYLPHTHININKSNLIDYSISSKIIEELKQGKVIIPKHQTGRESLYTQYCLKHISDDLRTLQQTIELQEDPKYTQAFKKVMKNNKFSPYNMFIMSWTDFDKYCTWLFTLLKEVEEKIDVSHYNNVQKRIYGYMSERLMNVYIEANNLKTQEYPIILFTDNKVCENIGRIEYYFKTLIKNISFSMSLPPADIE